ncbi:hypothetical protein [Oryzibacter oryziterrae]|uniref:hypothetical protein n=1 Tax=Oryzibacter oryziterrae TaxID=2766474 RepID=UPI001F2F0F1C|nr:hypothetical protein [Oryzibacter oryziterrae]
MAGRRVHASSGSRDTQDERFRASSGSSQDAGPAEGEAKFSATESYVKTLASAGFMAQLAAVHLGDAASGERRVRRDVSLVSGRAEAAYRSVGRLNTAIEPGFLSTVVY